MVILLSFIKMKRVNNKEIKMGDNICVGGGLPYYHCFVKIKGYSHYTISPSTCENNIRSRGKTLEQKGLICTTEISHIPLNNKDQDGWLLYTLLCRGELHRAKPKKKPPQTIPPD